MVRQIRFYERPGWQYSNFSAVEVYWNGWVCKTVEHGYQAYKFLDPLIQQLVLNARTPDDAKNIAWAHKEHFRSDWEEIKVSVMNSLIDAKCDQHPRIARKLEESGDAEIIEDSPVDYFWGCGKDGSGRNELGKSWMRKRTINRQRLAA